MEEEIKKEIPTIQIGKHGLTDNLIEEIKKNLKKKKEIKIKCLRFFCNSLPEKSNKEKISAVAQEISKKTNSRIVKQIGFTIILCKE